MPEYTEFQVFTDYPIFDADQHLREGPDCYTRHISKEFLERTLRPVGTGDETGLMVDGVFKPSDARGNQIPRPGSLKEMLRGMKKGASEAGTYQWMDPDPAFSDPGLRIAQLDKQNVQACFLYSNGPGLLAEHLLNDEDLYYASSWSYLRYLQDEWGFSTASRLFVAPVFSLRNPERTAEQLDWYFEQGGRVVAMVAGPAYGRSPGDRYFDSVWGRINDAGAVVVYHINDAIAGYKAARSVAWGEVEEPTFFTQSAWQWYWAYGDIPAQETFTSLIYANLFDRFPNLRIVSAEHGCEWIPMFVRKLDKMRGMGRNGRWINGQLPERPSEIFKRHFKVVPFWEDDVSDVVERVGTGVLLGGSDFPHGEGLAFPTQLVQHLNMLDDTTKRFVMRDNGMNLMALS